MDSKASNRPDYAGAIFPNRHRVAGCRLLPLTLGHALLLKRLESPFAMEEESALNHDQTLLACYVVSRSWSRAASGVNSRLIRQWLKWKLALRIDLAAVDTYGLVRYFTESWKCPQSFRGDRTTGGIRGSERLQILISHQRTALRKTFEQAMDTAVAEAILDHIESMESQGAIKVWSEAHVRQAKVLDDLKAGRIPIPKPEMPIKPNGAARG